MSDTDRWPGRLALMVAHCAGMVDLVALPVWVGTLIAQYKLDPQQAGGLATLFLAGAVVSSLFFAPRFNRFNGRIAAAAGFAVAGAAFFGVSASADYATMAALHALAGFSAGCGLSFTHGTIGRSAKPHRLFAIVGTALGVFAIVFLGATPGLVNGFGGPVLFKVFAGLMLISACVSALAFPTVGSGRQATAFAPPVRLGRAVWFGILGISCMGLVQAMMFSFLERMGADRGFGLDAVTGVLIALGFVNLFPAPLAALLEKRWSANKVVLAGPLVQAGLAAVIAFSTTFVPYAMAGAVFVAVMIFTHTFAFGLLARLDTSARALAGTPAMLMVGSAVGPILGGTLVKAFGYPSLGIAAVVIALGALAAFSQARADNVSPSQLTLPQSL